MEYHQTSHTTNLSPASLLSVQLEVQLPIGDSFRRRKTSAGERSPPYREPYTGAIIYCPLFGNAPARIGLTAEVQIA
jgi:hypothetical protein